MKHGLNQEQTTTNDQKVHLFGENRFNDKIFTELGRIIRQLGPGSKLYSERELTSILGVSRTALRDRLRFLDALGILRREQGTGTYIQSLDPVGLSFALDLAITSRHISTDELHSVRVALERQAALEAARQENNDAMREMQEALDIIVEAPSVKAVDEADFHFHWALMRASCNPALAFFAEALSGVLHRALAERRRRMRQLVNDYELMVELHRGIYEALLVGDPNRAVSASDKHFETFDRIMGKTNR